MNWLTRIFGRDHAADRIAQAQALRDDAARELVESRRVVRRVRAHADRNNFTERMAAGFAAYERGRRA